MNNNQHFDQFQQQEQQQLQQQLQPRYIFVDDYTYQNIYVKYLLSLKPQHFKYYTNIAENRSHPFYPFQLVDPFNPPVQQQNQSLLDLHLNSITNGNAFSYISSSFNETDSLK